MEKLCTLVVPECANPECTQGIMFFDSFDASTGFGYYECLNCKNKVKITIHLDS